MEADGRIDVWIDCDPGIDDAVMLACAAVSGDALNLHGISSVAGNQTSDRVTGNVLKLASFFDMPHVPLTRGAVRPLVREAQDAGDVHGTMGLGNVSLPASDRALDPRPAVLALHDAIEALSADRKMTLVPTGPLTNIALWMRLYPADAARVECIVLMGGATSGGNVTPTAEFNVWGDPEAAAIVFSSGLPIVMCGLDITLKCGLTDAQVAALAADDNPRRRALGEMLGFYNQVPSEDAYGVTVIHDAVTVLYLTDPQLFAGDQVAISVDCGDADRGTTRIAEDAPAAQKNVLLLNRVDMAEFQQVLLEKLARL